MKAMRIRRHVVGLAVAAWLIPSAAWACPLCKDALVEPGRNATQSRAARAYAISIAALLGAPAVLLGGITTMVVRSSRPRRQRVAALPRQRG